MLFTAITVKSLYLPTDVKLILPSIAHDVAYVRFPVIEIFDPADVLFLQSAHNKREAALKGNWRTGP